MQVDVEVLGQSTTHAYLTWTPYESKLTPKNFPAAPVDVRLKSAGGGTGKVVFSTTEAGPYSDELVIRLSNGVVSNFYVAGHYPFASSSDGDVTIECQEDATGTVLGKRTAAVRIRKDAESLTTGERDRFLTVMAQLNNQGLGIIQAFRDTHTSQADREAHGDYGFLSWHRCYLLDLERQLQAIDPFVTLPYWRFDLKAPKLFASDFLGVPFAASNPMAHWSTDGTIPLVVRSPRFNTATQPASGQPGFQLISEALTIGLGNDFLRFRSMEGTPHGAAHVSFNGYIDTPGTAAKDPSFFLLHCNVDRLWAKWQWTKHRFDKSQINTYPALGAAGSPASRRVGHNLNDTLWPWNGVTTSPRPGTAPRTPFPMSPLFQNPGSSPLVGDMIDYQGAIKPKDRLGFDYDDVRFEPTFV